MSLKLLSSRKLLSILKIGTCMMRIKTVISIKKKETITPRKSLKEFLLETDKRSNLRNQSLEDRQYS